MSKRKQWFLRIGDKVNIQKGKYIEPETDRTWIEKGTTMFLGFDRKLHYGEVTMDLQKNMNIVDGVSATGLSDYVYKELFSILPMEEIIDQYGLDEYDIKEKLDESFYFIGAITN